MPTYPYKCSNNDCGVEFDVVKSVAEIDQIEHCDKCGATGNRFIGRTHFYGASDWDKAEYNPGLGCVVRNASHRREVAKRLGVEEVGNDYSASERMISESDASRARKIENRWAKE